MNNEQPYLRLNRVLENLSNEIDVPPSKYEEAKDRYGAVGTWLEEDDSELWVHRPVIYPQGSFALGTAVRPLGDNDYDVDAVCLLQTGFSDLSQRQLKTLVGARLLHPRSRYKDMVDPKQGGRRCWTIKYADSSKFHLDVLPARPDDYLWLISLGVPEAWALHAIQITDRTTWDTEAGWPRSNPKGYAEWFKYQMRVQLEEAKLKLAQARLEKVEDIEDYSVRTPLQRLVQLLKRHRDVRYNGDEDKPISIIITTLAALAYDNEANLADAILNVVPRMRTKVESRDGVWWVPNPVNPEENFSDKWAERPRKAELFFRWLGEVEREHRDLLDDQRFARAGEYLESSYGERDARAAMSAYAASLAVNGAMLGDAPVVLTPRKTEEPPAPRVEMPSQPSKPWKP